MQSTTGTDCGGHTTLLGLAPRTRATKPAWALDEAESYKDHPAVDELVVIQPSYALADRPRNYCLTWWKTCRRSTWLTSITYFPMLRRF